MKKKRKICTYAREGWDCSKHNEVLPHFEDGTLLKPKKISGTNRNKKLKNSGRAKANKKRLGEKEYSPFFSHLDLYPGGIRYFV